MPLYKTEALILRTYKLGEADRIVVFLTRDRGKKRGVANGARRQRSPFAGALEPMTRVGMAYFEREQRELVRLSYAEPQCSPLRAGADDALSHVGYFAELIDEWAPEGDPNERLFRLGTATIEAMAAGAETAPLARYFEYWLLRLQGVYPPHLACHRCGVAFGPGAPEGLLDAAGHVFACRACAGGTPDAARRSIRLSTASLAFLEAAGRLAPADMAARPLAAGVDRELEAVHRSLMRVHLEKELRSARVLRDLGR